MIPFLVAETLRVLATCLVIAYLLRRSDPGGPIERRFSVVGERGPEFVER